MKRGLPLQPTLWRTCRVLANDTRLRIFGKLLQQPGQTVSALARALHLPRSAASDNLRALESRGVLTAHRRGRWVEYQVSPVTSPSVASGLVIALRTVFRSDANPIETVFTATTAFTHPRRIEVYRALHAGPRDFVQLQAVTGMSSRALLRHLKKLVARNFVGRQGALYHRASRSDELGRELARLAAG